jgi:putative CocE/NonD family hydrolase
MSALSRGGRATARIQWGLNIPMRDGVRLTGTLYLPDDPVRSAPAVLALTPYIAQTYHERGMYTAAHGYPFLAVDARGRGNSEGVFKPFMQEAKDGYDAVEWLARQSYCNGKVAMYGGSYLGYVQWATAKEFPPHLATIVPVASAYMGFDVPMRSNIPVPYMMQWLGVVWGRASQQNLLADNEFHWNAFRRWFESGVPFKELDTLLGNPSPIFQEWLAHPRQDDYWDAYNPTPEQYSKISIPILTITGSYDDDQPGALQHYRQHLRNASHANGARHYLVIGPWDHAGTLIPQAEFAGLKVGPTSLVDLQQLRLEWYTWTMEEGPKPEFLKKNVAYYVTGSEMWRYSDSLEAVTSHSTSFYLYSTSNPTDVFHSGMLINEPPRSSEPDHYVYDPREVSHARLESTVDPACITDQRLLLTTVGQQLIYRSRPLRRSAASSGFRYGCPSTKQIPIFERRFTTSAPMVQVRCSAPTGYERAIAKVSAWKNSFEQPMRFAMTSSALLLSHDGSMKGIACVSSSDRSIRSIVRRTTTAAESCPKNR